MDVEISGLRYYPVKSCAGIDAASRPVHRQGLAGDRAWMVVNAEGVFVTQRKYPSMACIAPTEQADGGLLLQHIHLGEVVSEVRVPAADIENQRKKVSVWKDACDAWVCDNEVNQWLTRAVGAREALQLVRYLPESVRLPGNPQRFGENTTLFADAAPFLVASTSSLQALNEQLLKQGLAPVNMRHFRPNIVLSGLPPFEEQQSLRLTHPGSGLCFRLVDHCQRCAVITVDPDSGVRRENAVPFKQLAALNPMPEQPKAPAFGMNAILETPTNSAVLTVGDRLQVARA